MFCDGCHIDCTVTVVWKDFRGRVTRRCLRCDGATAIERPDQPVRGSKR